MKLRAVVIAGSCYWSVTDADIISSSCDDVQSDRLLSVISSFRHTTCHHIVSCSNRSLAAYQQELQQQQQVMLVILT